MYIPFYFLHYYVLSKITYIIIISYYILSTREDFELILTIKMLTASNTVASRPKKKKKKDK